MSLASPDLSRRSFLGSALAAAALLPAVPAARALGGVRLEELVTVERIADDVHALIGMGGNTLHVGRAGAAEGLASDCKVIHGGPVLRAAIERAGLPLTRVVNTHHHGDHAGGNHAFRDLPVVGHENAKPRIEAQAQRAMQGGLAQAGRMIGRPDLDDATKERLRAFLDAGADLGPDDFTPDETITDEAEITIGEEPVELRHVSFGHTDNDVFLFLPTRNVMHAGDLLFHELHPYIDAGARATTRGWQACLDAMIARCDADTVVVPGHGEITDVTGLRAQRTYFDRMREAVQSAIDEGRSRDEILALQPDLGTEYGFDRMRPIVLGVLHDELTGRD